MASFSSGTGDATPTPASPQSTPEVVPIPRGMIRHEALGLGFFGLSMLDLVFATGCVAIRGIFTGGGVLIFLFLGMGIWLIAGITVVAHANNLRAAAEKEKLPKTLPPVSDTTLQELVDPSTGLPVNDFRGTVNPERTRLLPSPHRTPVNIPEALYITLHRAPVTEQPVAKIIYYHDIGPDGPSEKFLRRCLRIALVIYLLVTLGVLYHDSEWSRTMIVITGAIYSGYFWVALIVFNGWVDSLPMWFEIRQVEGPANTLAYGATAASCGHCGQKVENRPGNKAGQVDIEDGETAEKIV